MVNGLSDASFLKIEKKNPSSFKPVYEAKNDAIPSLRPPLKPFANPGEVLLIKNRPITLSPNMADYIKNEEAGERHKTEDGKFVVYRGAADKQADAVHDSVPLLTVGHGHSERGKIKVGNRQLKEGDTISEYQADELFKKDIKKIENSIKNNPECPLTSFVTTEQSDAMISYAFNAGVDKLYKYDPERDIPESMIECINNREIGKAQSKFNIITAGGVVSKGLAKRRIVEMVIFGEGKIYKEAEATFEKNKKALNGFKLIKHVYDINAALDEYGINDYDRHVIIKKLLF